MAKYEVKIDKFYGGVADDLLAGNAAQYAQAVNLDDFTQLGRLSPYRAYEADQTDIVNGRRILFGSDTTVYSIGDSSATSAVGALWSKALPTTAAWTKLANGTGGVADTAGMDQQGNWVYFWGGGTDVHRVNVVDGTYVTAVFTPTGATSGNLGPIFRHPNGSLYIARANLVASLDTEGAASLSADIAIDIPSGFQIVDLSHWNGYLVITARWGTDPTKSEVFFWNPANNNTYDFSKKLPEGVVYYCKNIGDEVAAIAFNGGSTDFIRDGKIFAYTYSGGQFELRRKLVVKESANSRTFGSGDAGAFVKNNQIYFTAQVGSDIGIWRFGRISGQYCLKRDRYGTNENTETTFQNIYSVGDYLYSIPVAGTINRTISTNTYSITGIYDTLIYGGNIQNKTKNLLGFSLTTRPLVSGANCTVSFRNDATTAFTTLGTHSGTDAVQTEMASTSTGLPKDWNTIQFRVETGGNAELTEIFFSFEDQPQATL